MLPALTSSATPNDGKESESRHEIRNLTLQNREPDRSRASGRQTLRTLEALRQAGYRIVRERDGDHYFLAHKNELQPLLVKLGDIAEVRFGLKTGANEFFYLEPVGKSVQEVVNEAQANPETPVRVRNGAGWEGEIVACWLRPVIKSPRELKTLIVRPEDLRYMVFMPPDDVRKAIDNGKTPPLDKYPHAKAYIEWGIKQGYHLRPTCASRKWWWDLEAKGAYILMIRATNDRFFFYFSESLIYHDQTFYSIINNAERSNLLIAALINSSITNWLSRSVASGASTALGQGVLWSAVYEAAELLLVNPNSLIASQQRTLLSAFHRPSQRPIRSIFEELGYPKPNGDYSNIDPDALTLEQVKQASPDRYELDSILFDVLGLNEEERLAVYRAVVQLVKDRLVKAKSV